MSDFSSFNQSIGKVLIPVFAAAALAVAGGVSYGIYSIGYSAGQRADAAKCAPAAHAPAPVKP